MDKSEGWLIGELKEKSGLSAQTIRYYEKLGLLEPAARTSAGYRMYSSAALDRLLLIQQAKRLQLSLDEIKTLLDLRSQGIAPYGTLQKLVQAHLNDLDQQLGQLHLTRRALACRLAQLGDRFPPADQSNDPKADALFQFILDAEALPPQPMAAGETIAQSQELLAQYQQGDRDFHGLELLRIDLAGAYLNEIDFSQTELQLANLIEACLAKSRFVGANLMGAYLMGAYLQEAILTGALLIGADLTEADLTGATLLSANLAGANLEGANLTGADLNETLLSGANLEGANLTRARFQNATLTEANLQGAILQDADLTGANLWRVVWPDGTLNES